MKVDKCSSNSIPIVIGFSLLLIGVVQIGALWTIARTIVPSLLRTSTIEEVQPAKFSPQIYQLEIVNNRIQLVPEPVYTTTTSPQLALKLAIEKLFTYSAIVDPTTAIPQGTKLLDLQVENKNIFLNLSSEFATGGGSSSMTYRVAQVLYTVTSIEPHTSVFLSIEGTPLDENYPLGGEGLLLEYPLTRQQFNRDFLQE